MMKEQEQIPSIGRIVHYRLSAAEAEQINQQYGFDAEVSGSFPHLTAGQTRKGNRVAEGDMFPMVIVRVWGSTPTSAVNGQVLLDGNDQLWVTSRMVGDQAGTFAWPTRS